MVSRSDPRRIRAMLGTAPGYAVVDREGKRIGAFVELAGGDRIVIRHDGIFVWHRRLLPITTVATVIPDKRAVLLTIDEGALSDTETQPNPATRTSPIAEDDSDPSGDWRDRIDRYIAPANGDADEGELTRERADNEPPQSEETRRHLLFISTPAGYSFVEREGPPPPLGGHIELPGQAIPFVVLKVSRSPLPNDDRTCAYLQPTA
jgi:hypothetical protein